MINGKGLTKIIIQDRAFFIGENERVFFSFTVSSLDYLKYSLEGLENLIGEVFCELELFDLRIDRTSCCGDSKVLFISAGMTTRLIDMVDNTISKTKESSDMHVC